MMEQWNNGMMECLDPIPIFNSYPIEEEFPYARRT